MQRKSKRNSPKRRSVIRKSSRRPTQPRSPPVACAAHLSERKQQEAIAAAEQILAKAREASAIEHERTMESLKRELGRLVVDTTAKVAGKVLTPEDQQNLQEEAARQLAG